MVAKKCNDQTSSNFPNFAWNFRPLFNFLFSLFFILSLFLFLCIFPMALNNARSKKKYEHKCTPNLMKNWAACRAEIAILLGRFLIFNCCRKAVSKFHNDQRCFPNESDKENKKETAKTLTRVTAGKTSISAVRQKKSQNLCRDGRKQTSPKFLSMIFLWI